MLAFALCYNAKTFLHRVTGVEWSVVYRNHETFYVTRFAINAALRYTLVSIVNKWKFLLNISFRYVILKLLSLTNQILSYILYKYIIAYIPKTFKIKVFRTLEKGFT